MVRDELIRLFRAFPYLLSPVFPYQSLLFFTFLCTPFLSSLISHLFPYRFIPFPFLSSQSPFPITLPFFASLYSPFLSSLISPLPFSFPIFPFPLITCPLHPYLSPLLFFLILPLPLITCPRSLCYQIVVLHSLPSASLSRPCRSQFVIPYVSVLPSPFFCPPPFSPHTLTSTGSWGRPPGTLDCRRTER